MKRLVLSLLFLPLMGASVPLLAADSIESWLRDIKAVGPEGKGNAAASQAWRHLSQVQPDQLPRILEAFDSANELAANWLRSAVEVVVDRTLAAQSELPVAEIGAYWLDTRHNARARFLAFQIIRRVQPKAANEMIPGLLSDPNPSLRRLAVQELIDRADGHAEAQATSAATLLYRQALGFARDIEQVQHLDDALQKLGQTIDLPEHFGFLMNWLVVGPFDNTERQGFEKVFRPEVELNFHAEHQGKNDGIRWKPYTSQHDYGMININEVCGSVKEVTAYAYTEFYAANAGPVELRLGCKNAWKIWCNGQYVFGRDEYHRGAKIDQYILPVTMQAGKNTILIKICQNEQVEEWTKEWEFQLRVCDSTGTAILSTMRPPNLEKLLTQQLSLLP